MKLREIKLTIINQCILPDSLLRQEVVIANHSPYDIWLPIDHLRSNFFPIERIKATYTTIGCFSDEPHLGYMPLIDVYLTSLKSNTDTTIFIDTDISYRMFKSATLIINIDFLEDSEDIYHYIQTYQREGRTSTSIPYREYENKAIRYSVTVLP